MCLTGQSTGATLLCRLQGAILPGMAPSCQAWRGTPRIPLPPLTRLHPAPFLQGTILPGVTRRSIIELARSRGYTVEEEPVSVTEAMEADEVRCACCGCCAVHAVVCCMLRSCPGLCRGRGASPCGRAGRGGR